MLWFPSRDDKMPLLCLEREGGGEDAVNWWDFYCFRNTVALSRIIKCFSNHNSPEAINKQEICAVKCLLM